MKKNIFIIGLNEFNLRKLKRLPGASDMEFHNLLDRKNIIDAEQYDVNAILENGREQLRAFEGSIDAIIGYMDFPVSTLAPILASEFGARATSLESLLKCEHKYWSRLEQKRLIPENTPDFVAFDPFEDKVEERIDLDFPYWVKPIKSFNSHLGFRIESESDLRNAVDHIKPQVGRVGGPFEKVTRMLDGLPEELDRINGNYCIAESIIGGHQCTLEGAMFEGDPYYHGIVDSIREPGSSVFQRYEFPSELPQDVKRRMEDIATRFLTGVGYDNAAFNIEFFWDKDRDRIWFLEVNTRVAQHHSDLFEKVNGVSNHAAAVNVALGIEPRAGEGKGEFSKAAVFFTREHQDAYVNKVPTPERVKELEDRYPGTVIQLQVEEGMNLSDMVEQDSYSYNPAIIYIGGKDQEELLKRYEDIKNELGIQLEKPRNLDPQKEF